MMKLSKAPIITIFAAVSLSSTTIATCAHEKIARSGGHRYREARNPELYRHILGAEHRSEQKVAWISASKRDE